MAIKNEYLQGVYAGLQERNPEQKEFLQAVEEVLGSLEPIIERRPDLIQHKIIERIVEPPAVHRAGAMSTGASTWAGACSISWTGCSSSPAFPSAPATMPMWPLSENTGRAAVRAVKTWFSSPWAPAWAAASC